MEASTNPSSVHMPKGSTLVRLVSPCSGRMARALHQPSRQKTILSVRTSRFVVETVQLLSGLRFLRKIHCFRRSALHFIRQLVRTDARIEFGIVLLVFAPQFVQAFQQAQFVALLRIGALNVTRMLRTRGRPTAPTRRR